MDRVQQATNTSGAKTTQQMDMNAGMEFLQAAGLDLTTLMSAAELHFSP